MFLPIKLKPEDFNLEYEKFIFLIEEYFTSDECQEIKNYLETSNGKHRRGSKNPENYSASFSTCLFMNFNNVIYSKIDDLLLKYNNLHNFNLLFIEPLEIKKYDIGDKFENHRDNYVATSLGLDRKLNLIVQLSDETEYEGGDLKIGLNPVLDVPKKLGTVVIFPAYYTHQVCEIIKGSRYSLIGHVWGPEFK